MVRNYDVDVPANTIRAWVIGLVLCTVGSGVNMLFSLRNPSVAINTYVIQLVAYPIGQAWDFVFPDKEWNLLGLKFNLRPGKFNYKEHVVIVAMSNVGYLVFPPRRSLAAHNRLGCVWWRHSVCHRCHPGPETLLWPGLWLGLPDPLRRQHPVHRLRPRWSGPPLSGLARCHDLAR